MARRVQMGRNAASELRRAQPASDLKPRSRARRARLGLLEWPYTSSLTADTVDLKIASGELYFPSSQTRR
jgi:hypothetical protein